MELQKIETLLLQEMEEVKGGTSGVCACDGGAGQSENPDGTCECKKGAGQLLPPPDPNFPVCRCNAGGAAQ